MISRSIGTRMPRSAGGRHQWSCADPTAPVPSPAPVPAGKAVRLEISGLPEAPFCGSLTRVVAGGGKGRACGRAVVESGAVVKAGRVGPDGRTGGLRRRAAGAPPRAVNRRRLPAMSRHTARRRSRSRRSKNPTSASPRRRRSSRRRPRSLLPSCALSPIRSWRSPRRRSRRTSACSMAL